MKTYRAVLLRHSGAILTLLLIAEVIALALFQSPNERLLRYIGFDSGVDLTMQDLLRRGYRPTVDFGCIYGPLPLLFNRAWYTVAGLSPRAFRVEVVLGTCLTAWGMARFARARRVGAAGWALIALAVPDLLFPSYSTFVHVLEPALLVHGLAEQARGRRENALAFATAACFVKPSMGYVYGFFLLICIALAARGGGTRRLGPRARAGGRVGDGPRGRDGGRIRGRDGGPDAPPGDRGRGLPAGALRVLPGGRTHVLDLAGGGPAGLFPLRGRLLADRVGLVARGWARGIVAAGRGERPLTGRSMTRSSPAARVPRRFRHLRLGHRTSWTYYFPILILGLAALAKRARGGPWIAWCLAAMLLVNDRSKLLQTYREWSTSAPSAETLGLWATPAERSEWLKVLELTRGRQPVLLTTIEGSVPLVPRFAPPAAAYFCPGLTLPAEARRKADQLASASMIVAAVPRDWRGFALWPELKAAMEGCEPVFEGETFRVYRRVRPPSFW